MRWGVNNFPPMYKPRRRCGFLWLPKTDRASEETRWLEIATWEEEFTGVYMDYSFLGSYPVWIVTRWID